MRREMLSDIWSGFALCGVFFYPLSCAIKDEPFFMQWQRIHSIDALLTYGWLSLCCALLFWLIRRIPNPAVQIIPLALLLTVPFLSFLGYLLRQVGIKAWLTQVHTQPFFQNSFFVLAGLCTVVFCRYARRRPQRLVYLGYRIPKIFTPLAFVWLYAAVSGSFDAPAIWADSPGTRVIPSEKPRNHVFILLFDELDRNFLFDKQGNVAVRFPHIRKFAAAGSVYRAASSPADNTLESIYNFIREQRGIKLHIEKSALFETAPKTAWVTGMEKNIFADARRLGYRVSAMGWYLPYCEIWGKHLDYCRSFSAYNLSASRRQSTLPDLYDPILTVFNLWPNQSIFGYFKNPASGILHQELLSAIGVRFRKAVLLAPRDNHFIFAHFGIPHAPFVFDAEDTALFGDHFQPDANSYLKQVERVDVEFGHLLAFLAENGMYENATIVLMSDHALRCIDTGGIKTDVPVIVKLPHQAQGRQVAATTFTEKLAPALLIR
ncbi:MAG: sulfatase-like hydrolase/transferase [Spirochaetes bacterium]|nr:sulfatase-like hydrolase/transferase [Spirochaetota bacterium]